MPLEREVAFNINDVARLLKTYADQRARDFGMTRAQWAVLARVERSEGLKQCELADPLDRRAKRLYLTPAARPVLDGLTRLGQDIMATVLAGIEPAAVEQLLVHLLTLKTNLRGAIAKRANETPAEKRYGLKASQIS